MRDNMILVAKIYAWMDETHTHTLTIWNPKYSGWYYVYVDGIKIYISNAFECAFDEALEYANKVCVMNGWNSRREDI